MVAMKLLPAVCLLSIYRMQEQDGTMAGGKKEKKKPQQPSLPLS